jgi:hypothetical protein
MIGGVDGHASRFDVFGEFDEFFNRVHVGHEIRFYARAFAIESGRLAKTVR